MAKAKSSKKPKVQETGAFSEKFKNARTIGIWNVDEDGDKVGDFPIIAFGLKKAQAILAHIDEIQAFVDKETARQSAASDEDEKPAKRKVKVKRRAASADSDDDE